MIASRKLVPLLLAGSACGGSPAVPAARFANAPAVAVVDDRRDVPRSPSTERDLQTLDFFDASIERPITRTLELPRARRALGVNALDEVPDSTWFTNRIGAHALRTADVGNGPLTIDSPELHKPWMVHSTKVGGGGFIITDARGIKFMLKFDDPELPELESGSHVVINRLLWACGYNVPEDRVVFFRPNDLLLAPGAMVKDRLGNATHPLQRTEIEHQLAVSAHAADHRIRAMASRWLGGTSLGPVEPEGTRDGDPNDRIPHELRRDLRGEYPIFAWLDHTEPTRGNFLDMLVTDSADPTRHYVKHFQIDFGRGLGAKVVEEHDLRRGFVYELDYGNMLLQLVTLGLAPRPWSEGRAPALRGISPAFVASNFDPDGWVPDSPYGPFETVDRFDKFWGAKIMARFTPAQIRAAVDAAQFSDPRAAAYLTDTLVARQRATVAYWFTRVNPLDRFGVDLEGRLCFDDLAITARVSPATPTRYTFDGFDAAARPIGGHGVWAAEPNGRTCLPATPATTGGQGYTIVRITTTRPNFRGTTFVHLAPEPTTGRPRVIGVWRS